MEISNKIKSNFMENSSRSILDMVAKPATVKQIIASKTATIVGDKVVVRLDGVDYKVFTSSAKRVVANPDQYEVRGQWIIRRDA